MTSKPFLRASRWTGLILGISLLALVSQACGGKVMVDNGSAGAGGLGGLGGAGGGPSDACGWDGPADPNAPCKTEGAACAFGDTSCVQQWTCHAGKWSEAGSCTGNGVGGFSSSGGG